MFHRWWELSFVFHDQYNRLSIFGKPEANLEGCSKLQIRALVIRVWGRDSGGNLALVLGNVATAPLTPYSLGRPFCLHSHPIHDGGFHGSWMCNSVEWGRELSTHVIVQELNIAMFLQSIHNIQLYCTRILIIYRQTNKLRRCWSLIQTQGPDPDPLNAFSLHPM